MEMEVDFLLQKCGGREGAVRLFDFLPMCQVYGKDYRAGKEGCFFFANARFLHEKGLGKESDLLGRTDYDFYPAELAAQYVAEDECIFNDGKSVIGQAWLVIEPGQIARIWRSSKIPIFDDEGNPLAIIGAMYETQEQEGSGIDRLRSILVYIQRNLSEKLTLETLAKQAGYSVSRFASVFREAFDESPGNYVKRMRVTSAAYALLASSDPVGEIGVRFGFYDNSHFTRHFKDILGVGPKEYRQSKARIKI